MTWVQRAVIFSLVAIIATCLLLTMPGCGPCGGRLVISREPYRASIQPAPIMLDTNNPSATVPFTVEPIPRPEPSNPIPYEPIVEPKPKSPAIESQPKIEPTGEWKWATLEN